MYQHKSNLRAALRLRELYEGDLKEMDTWVTAEKHSKWFLPWSEFIVNSSALQLANIVKLSGICIDYAEEVLDTHIGNELEFHEAKVKVSGFMEILKGWKKPSLI